jgi:hypothetical protein
MISSDERQTESILLKWREIDSPVWVMGFTSDLRVVKQYGRIDDVRDSVLSVETEDGLFKIDFSGAKIWYGEARESPAEEAKTVATDAGCFDFILRDGSLFGVIESRKHEA